ncbi:MAG: L-threonylcarbamoyladenylate synthase [Parvibaculum sp.]|nr:L-threonylcarbamoyladenylate synthase [Parvibaculum sp.]|tara:strand:- start:12181 stop:13146 length:966 start_codon:yes stop_codon:yes gene_type:complete
MPVELRDADDAAIAAAGEHLREGRLVAFPTETVYGLGADATNERAVASIFEAKGRPTFNPLIVHVVELAEAKRHVLFTAKAILLAEAFWPGGITLVLPRLPTSPLSLLVSAGLNTAAIRVPAHPIAQKLLKATGRPIAAPSANASGEISPTRAAHVMASLGHAETLAMVLDGGPCVLGLESTVIGFPNAGPTLLRPGAVARGEIEAVIGQALLDADAASGEAGRSSPGQLASHYAPRANIRLNVSAPRDDEIWLGFGSNQKSAAFNLSPSGDLTEAAANLFAMLRAIDDAADGRNIAVAPVPREGLGEAINDRLARAAAPR